MGSGCSRKVEWIGTKATKAGSGVGNIYRMTRWGVRGEFCERPPQSQYTPTQLENRSSRSARDICLAEFLVNINYHCSAFIFALVTYMDE
jgi:hypothetical protein